MQEKSSHSGLNVLIALAIIVAVFAAGYFYITRDRTSDADLLVSAPAGTGDAVEGDLLTALGQLRQLTLDESVFNDPIFRSFSDYGQELVPQSAGRPNPFAPFATTSDASTFTVPSASQQQLSSPASSSGPATATTTGTSTPAR